MAIKYHFDTLQVHAGQEPDPVTGARAVPIYQTTSYVFADVQEAEDRFGLKSEGNIYSRITNPTTAVFEERITALEGGTNAVAVASGAAAISYAILNVAESGDHIVSAHELYGGTYNLFATTLPKFGVRTTFVKGGKIEDFAKEIRDNTKAIYCETLGNPNGTIIDFDALGELAKSRGIPLIVDATFSTPYLFKPFEHGINVVVHSATKFIGGHGTSMGGVIVDGGNFNWDDPKFPGFIIPDESYHGVRFADLGDKAFGLKIRTQLLRDTGASVSPFNAWLFIQGLETLSLRIERHVKNAIELANYLEQHPKVETVNYAALESSPYHSLAQKYFPKGTGSIFSFTLKTDDKSKIASFIEHLEIFSLLANVADAKSLVIHPASTTHQQLSETQLEEAGIYPNLVRLSIGIEDVQDLKADLEQALAQI